MADSISQAARSANMRGIRSRDTQPEMIVRRMLHRLGYRFRLQAGELPGKPDIIFRPRRKCIFVHGCFWHQHPDPECREGRMPKSRLDYWQPKLERNMARDAKHMAQLQSRGWHVLILWECEIEKAAPAAIESRLFAFLDDTMD